MCVGVHISVHMIPTVLQEHLLDMYSYLHIHSRRSLQASQITDCGVHCLADMYFLGHLKNLMQATASSS